MSIQDFVAIPLGKYIENNLAFGKKLSKPPKVFGVNYFLKDKNGNFLNGIRDKHVWIKWIELRTHDDVRAIKAPTGFIPCYEDLVPLFKKLVNKDYTKEDYTAQFTIRVVENIEKIDRVIKYHRTHVENSPAAVFNVLEKQKERLLAIQKKFGDYVSPFDLIKTL